MKFVDSVPLPKRWIRFEIDFLFKKNWKFDHFYWNQKLSRLFDLVKNLKPLEFRHLVFECK